jgi:hypothetical protein
MSMITTQELLQQVKAQEADLTALRREIALLRAASTTNRRRSVRRRLGAALALALLVALVPLSLFAANPFTDLNAGSPHNANIDAIYNAGITTGCVPNESYCPNDFVTREQMASFLARTAGLGDNLPVATARRLGFAYPPYNTSNSGYAADELIRVGHNTAHPFPDTLALSPAVDPTTGDYKTIATVTIDRTLRSGTILVSASATIDDFEPACNCEVQVRLAFSSPSGVGASFSPVQYVRIGGAANSVAQQPVSINWGFSFFAHPLEPAPYPQTVRLQARQTSGTGTQVRAFDATLYAIYVPSQLASAQP